MAPPRPPEERTGPSRCRLPRQPCALYPTATKPSAVSPSVPASARSPRRTSLRQQPGSGLRQRPSLRNLLILFDGMPACRPHEPWFNPPGLRRGRQEQRTTRRVAQSHGAQPPAAAGQSPQSGVGGCTAVPAPRDPAVSCPRLSLITPVSAWGHVASSLCVVSTPDLPVSLLRRRSSLGQGHSVPAGSRLNPPHCDVKRVTF